MMNSEDLEKVIWRVNDSPDYYTLMLCCSGTLKVMPRLSVCNDYHIPVTPKQAEWFLKSKLDMVINFDNFNSSEIFDTHVMCKSYARRVQAMMTDILIKPYNKGKYKITSVGYDIYKSELEKLVGKSC